MEERIPFKDLIQIYLCSNLFITFFLISKIKPFRPHYFKAHFDFFLGVKMGFNDSC